MTHTASLVWVTPKAQEVIAYCARVSNPANQSNHDTAPRLLRYCIEHGHWSVFEMASMCLEINTTRAIAPQILRHRSFSFQEFSLRYAEAMAEPVLSELRVQDSQNRQNSIPINQDGALATMLQEDIASHYASGMALYDRLLEFGIAREVARDVLPLATPTRLYMSGTIRSWIHYTQLRTEPGTQKEHRQIAAAARRILHEQIPVLAELEAVP